LTRSVEEPCLSHAYSPVVFALEARPDRSRVIVAVRGELDLASVDTLQAALDELRSAGWTDIVVDLRELQFIDSTGLSLLLAADRDARREGWAFSVVDGCPAVARLLQASGLGGHFRRAQVRP
jgi:anti-anti-sigma factor